MINIQISNKYHEHQIWGRHLMYHLTKNPNVNCNILKYPLPIMPVYRGWKNFTPFIYEDIIFIIDDWDHASPTCFLLNNTNIPKIYLHNNVCILKVQYCNLEINNYDEIYKQSGIKVLPFTMFANHTFDLENFKWNADHNHKFTCVFTGKVWRNRIGWLKFAENNKQELNCKIDLSNGAGDWSPADKNEEFYGLLKQTKWGVILKGKGCGGKNRREVEFSSFGMPMALNYIPQYPFSFEPDKDYVLLKSPEDLLKLKHIDPEPFAERSQLIYKEYFSPQQGLLNSFDLVYRMAKEHFKDREHRSEINLSSITPDPNTISIVAQQGYRINNTKAGDKISIQYVSGSWRSWGKNTRRGGVNPDNTNNRGGDRAKLAIFHKNNFQLKHLTIVPEHTAHNPFIFIVPEDNLSLYLDINDQQGYGRGTVNYIVKLIR